MSSFLHFPASIPYSGVVRVHQRGGCHPIPSHYDGGLLHQGIEYRLSPHQHSGGQRAQRHLYTHTGKGECGEGSSVTIINPLDPTDFHQVCGISP